MTRIIAGEFGGRRIAVPQKGTRPTTDRVREALFSRLDHADLLRGAVVADLFAGSGALGIEALSRGAASATFVEAARPAASIIRANLADLGAENRATVAAVRVLPFLQRSSETFSLALIDPPYDLRPSDLTAALAALAARLAPGAEVVLEWSTRGEAPVWPSGIEPGDAKDYGETRLHYATAASEPGGVASGA